MSTKASCTCGCGSTVAVRTPQRVHNRPGLGALRYRVGAHGTFLDTMLARLASRRELDGLTERGTDDFSVALLDAWAVLGDVLTFYTERIANEGYLRTATEQWSVDQLGRLVGHRPRPAVGASVFLSYNLDPEQDTIIPAGSRANSVAEAGGSPQTFETAEDIRAKTAWNDLGVRKYYPFDLTAAEVRTRRRILVQGVTANLNGGDRLVFEFIDDSASRTVEPERAVVVSSTVNGDLGHTVVDLQPPDPDADYRAEAVLVQSKIDFVTGKVSLTGFSKRINDEILVPLRARLPTTPPSRPDEVEPVERMRLFLKDLASLHEAHALADENGLASTGWIAALDGLIKQFILFLQYFAAATGQRPPGEPVPAPPDCGCGYSSMIAACSCDPMPADDPTAVLALARLIAPLTKAPSSPPAGTANLARSVERAFAPGSDVGAQLITAAEPRLQPTLYKAWRKLDLTEAPRLNKVFVLRLSSAVFGATLQGDGKYEPTGAAKTNELPLSGPFDGIAPGSWVLVEKSGTDDYEILRVTEARQRQVSLTVALSGTENRTQTATVTVLTLNKPWRNADDVLSTVAQYSIRFKADQLTPLGDPVPSDVEGGTIELADLHEDLRSGRYLIVSGERSDLPRRMRGVRAGELVMIAGVRQGANTPPGSIKPTPGSRPLTTLVLAEELAYTYHRDTVRVHGNVVEATQGESRLEVLGSGDASQASQSFPVRGTPITWLPSDTPLGATSTLRVSVGGVRWHEAEAVSLLGAEERAYLTRVADGGATTVTFGDGVHGSRLPTGPENVQARYRAGAGNGGNVAPDTITQPVSRPLGVAGVTNPIAASGGGDGDGPEDARRVTPLRTIALDRLVSVADYESFTKARAGIGKASVREISDGQRDVVHVTIAGIKDAPIDPSSRLQRSLVASLGHFGELGLPVTVAGRELKVLVLSAGVKVHPDHEWELVEPRLRKNLLHHFGFAARELAQPVYRSEVVSVMQGTEGVDYVDVDVFDGVSGRLSPQEIVDLAKHLRAPKVVVPASAARWVHRTHTAEPPQTLTSVAEEHGLTVSELVGLNPQLDSLRLVEGQELVVAQGIAPAQLVIFSPAVRDTLILRRL
ncbi:putative baseplate assembly protein [Allokutzneria albata]|uniref:Putative baseplate assembly protein n=1 Tax=Allokutzneria albata TaxID=211114 RepID=A0A1G9QYM1_ALLAB|nr:putative baseplate assembly protein [Allokutzneria albata]SDM16126.1 putative baseplate assembly protein [Allokutzneria albata]